MIARDPRRGISRLQSGEKLSDEFPGHIERGDGSFRKPWLRPGGKLSNLYCVRATCSWCSVPHLQNAANHKKHKRSFCSQQCSAMGQYRVGSEKNKRGAANHKSHRLTCVPNHPFAKKGYVPTHRLAVEASIDRLLKPEEIVHHIDLVPSNNDVDNLQLCSGAAEHNAIHASLNNCVAALLASGALRFNRKTKTYEVSGTDQC